MTGTTAAGPWPDLPPLDRDGSLFDALTAHTDPDAVFLDVPDGPTLTYGEVLTRSAAFAGALRAAGVGVGDRVVVQVAKSPDAVALYLACLRSGIVYVTINTAYTDAEVGYFVDDAGAALLVCDPDRAAGLAATGADILTLGPDGTGSLVDAAADAEPFDAVEPRSGDDLACILYTSGTTGRSKGAMLTHRGLILNGRALHHVWGFTDGDVLLHTLPIFHVHGLFVALHCAMLQGAPLLFCPRFDADQTRALLPRATVLMGVPTHYVRLLAIDEFGAADAASIRLFTSGSAPMTELVHADFTERTGHRIVERYGMTECGIITSNRYGGECIPGTVGYALPDMEVRVVDGSVQVRGDHLFTGYWQLPEKTAAEFTDDGWFITGDVGEQAPDGRIALAGRAGDMIISGGYNVYPKEIELVLDAVDGVVESAVIGAPHPDFGEGVVAVVVYEPGVDREVVDGAIDEACRAELARFKHPKVMLARDELPRNAMGKVGKAALRTELADTFTTG